LSAEDRARFRFVHVSTDEVFGSLGADDPAFCETTPYDPRSPYSATKAASDHLARAWWHTYTLPVCVTNCTNNYGPRQFPEKLIPLLTLKALTGETLPVYGQGENVRDWLFVDDHARGLCRVAERGEPGATYCFGGNTERTNLQVVEALCDAVDALCAPLPSGQPRRSLIEFVADRPGHDFRYAMKTGFVDRALGWQPSMRFEEGLRATIQWYLDNEAWWRPLVSARYAGERLGLKRAS
jgi:dTDP-glucose 4,6-dehydratase